MKQLYIIAHTIVGDDQVIDKVFLYEWDAINYGRTLATNNLEYNVSLYKQGAERTAKVQFVKHLREYTK